MVKVTKDGDEFAILSNNFICWNFNDREGAADRFGWVYFEWEIWVHIYCFKSQYKVY